MDQDSRGPYRSRPGQDIKAEDSQSMSSKSDQLQSAPGYEDVEKQVDGITATVPTTKTSPPVLDFEPGDPGNPFNWPTWKRVYHVLSPSLFAFVVTIGSSIYAPAYPQVAARFGVSHVASLCGIFLYVLGLGLGPMISAPVSETAGRLVVYRLSMPICGLFTLGAGFSNNLASLLVCRFFAGAAGSPVLAVGGATIADLFTPRERVTMSCCFLMCAFMGPCVGPIIGGFVAQYKDWRWTQWVTLFILGAAYIFSLPMKETYKKIILQKRMKKTEGFVAPPKPPPAAALKFILTVTLLRPLAMLVQEPIVIFISLYNAFTFSILFAFFEVFPLVFGGIYKFDVSQIGLSFVSVAIGVILGVITAILCDRMFYQKEYTKIVAEGKTMVEPEHRLYAAMFGSSGVSVGLFWFAWTSRGSVHWIVPAIGAIPFAWGNLCIFLSGASYLIDGVYGPLTGASAMAANGLLRYGMSSVFPLFTVQMYKKMTIPWATSLFGFISLLMLPIPFVLFKYGPAIRAKSRYDTVKG